MSDTKPFNGINTIWIAWEIHRRTRELCQAMGIRPFLLSSHAPRIVRHPMFVFQTLNILLKQRPDILFVQNPSVLLSIMVCFLHRFFKYRLVIDTHNGGLLPEGNVLRRLGAIYAFINRQAEITMVTNRQLAALVTKNGGRAVVLQDKIPVVPSVDKKELSGRRNVVFICTFGADEPVKEVITAASLLPRWVVVHVTGKVSGQAQEYRAWAPDNIIFTDYLEENAYWRLLISADVVIDLTNRADCLVCGAYEAVAAGTPLILSRFDALEDYFNKGVLFTDNNSRDIADTILRAIDRLDVLKKQISELKATLEERWQTSMEELVARVKH